MKKLLSMLLVLAMCITLFAACGSDDKAPPASGELNDAPVDTPDESAKKADDNNGEVITLTMECIVTPALTTEWWDGYIKSIEDKMPNVKIEPVHAPGTERNEWRKTKYAAGDVADICLEPFEYANIPGALAEVPDFLKDKCDPDLLAEYDGVVNMVPSSLQIKSQCYYNKTAFEEAGIDDEPTTWDEFLDVCEKLKSAGHNPLMACKENWFNFFGYGCGVLQPDVYDAMPNFMEDLKAGKVKWNNPVIVESCERWQELYNNDYYVPGYASYSYAQAVDEFFQGTSAMIINGSWMAPQIDELEDGLDFEIGIFPTPQQTGVKSISVGIGTWGVFSSCKYTDEAFKVIDLMMSETELYAEYLKADNLASATLEPVTYEASPTVDLFNTNCINLEKVIDFQAVFGDNAIPVGFPDVINDQLAYIAMGANIEEALDIMDEEYARLNKS